jgi:hypothetical protein
MKLFNHFHLYQKFNQLASDSYAATLDIKWRNVTISQSDFAVSTVRFLLPLL